MIGKLCHKINSLHRYSPGWVTNIVYTTLLQFHKEKLGKTKLGLLKYQNFLLDTIWLVSIVTIITANFSSFNCNFFQIPKFNIHSSHQPLQAWRPGVSRRPHGRGFHINNTSILQICEKVVWYIWCTLSCSGKNHNMSLMSLETHHITPGIMKLSIVCQKIYF